MTEDFEPLSDLRRWRAEQEALESRLRALGCEGENVHELTESAVAMLERFREAELRLLAEAQAKCDRAEPEGYVLGWRDAMFACSEMMHLMVKWDHSSLGVYETYEMAFDDVACVSEPRTSGPAMYAQWVVLRDS